MFLEFGYCLAVNVIRIRHMEVFQNENPQDDEFRIRAERIGTDHFIDERDNYDGNIKRLEVAIAEALRQVHDKTEDDVIADILVKSEAVSLRELIEYFKDGHPERKEA